MMDGILWGCFIALGLALLAGIILFLVWQNNSLTREEHHLAFPDFPKEAATLRLVQVSDLHNKWFGENQQTLLAALKKERPDVILITGDLIDKRRTRANRMEPALSLAEQAVKIAPVYYVSGNHEAYTDVYKTLKPKLIQLGVIILDDKIAVFEKHGAKIPIVGLAGVAPQKMEESHAEILAQRTARLKELLAQVDKPFFLLLSHRPDWCRMYQGCGVPLTFSGHAHGGQVRLPLIGGLFAPNQGLFPRYTAGLYQKDGRVVCVSRGLGNSKFPLRVFNRPQIVTVVLSRGEPAGKFSSKKPCPSDRA